MCGIAGLVSSSGRGIDAARLGAMTDLVAYRGPDAQGFLLADAAGTVRLFESSRPLTSLAGFTPTLGLGHRRLSILDLTEAGRQPMSYQDQAYWIVYNGEVFNFTELAEELRALGYAFRTHTDTEVILAAYDAWGDDCLRHFNGMWAFALWDRRRSRLLCARDRWGIKPFYYRWADGLLAFGSEIKQLVQGERPRLHLPTLYDFLVLGLQDHLDTTFFDGVRQLMPGQYLTLDLGGGSPEVRRFYELKPNHDFGPDDQEAAVRRVGELLSDSVRIRLRSDVPVGSCLSGGLDSSSVVSLMSHHYRAAGTEARQHTFTFVSPDKDRDESDFAQRVVDHCGVTSHFIRPSPEEVRADILDHFWHLDEPCGSLSMLAQWYVFKAARAAGIPVMLDGQGGDELFLGYERYYSTALRHWLLKGRWGTAFREYWLAGTRSRIRHAFQFLFLLYFQFAWVRGLGVTRRAASWLAPGFLGQCSARQRLLALGLTKDPESVQIQEVCRTQLQHLLRYEDRNSMAFSVEARLPMLDYRLVELAVGLPVELKIRHGWTKYALREAIKGRLPAEVTWRRNKFGFEAPQRRWMSVLLPDLASMMDEGLATRPLLNVDRLRDGAREGTLDDKVIWRFYNLEHWARLFSVDASL